MASGCSYFILFHVKHIVQGEAVQGEQVWQLPSEL
jgi:hypothetical protein